ncbi:MAG: hypothetical protein ACXWGS_12695, partial [Solirubrobacterales bacterium]
MLVQALVGVRKGGVEQHDQPGAERQAQQHLTDAAAVQGRDQQAERGGGEHDAAGEAEHRVDRAVGGRAEHQEHQPAQARRQAGSEHPDQLSRAQGRDCEESRGGGRDSVPFRVWLTDQSIGSA